MTAQDSSRQPTIYIALLVPVIVAIFGGIALEIGWSGSECGNGAPVGATLLAAGAVLIPLAGSVYAMLRRRQRPLVVLAQSCLSVALSAFLLFWVMIMVAGNHNCFS